MELLKPDEYKFIEVAYSRSKTYSGPLDDTFLHHIYHTFTYWDCHDEVKEILELSNELKVKFSSLLKGKLPFINADISHLCLLENPRSYMLLTDFGEILREDGMMLQEVIQRINHYAEVGSIVPVRLRSYQLLGLYAQYNHRTDHHPSDYEVILQVMWSSIPDPLLTISEFIKTFDWVNPQVMPRLMKAWDWYCKLVRDPEDPDRCPRSLKHLTRCAIRQRLADGFQLPRGIQELGIPKILEQYLLLRDFETKLKNQRQNFPTSSLFQV